MTLTRILHEQIAKADGDHGLQGTRSWRGLRISIENRAGSVRRGVSRNGEAWETRMRHAYGYIHRSEGVDGDRVDVYLGPKRNAPLVFIVHQRNPATNAYDEDKAMLGFEGLSDALRAFEAHYDRPGFTGLISVLPFDAFKNRVTNPAWRGRSLRATRGDIERLRRRYPNAWEELRHASSAAGPEAP